MAVAKLKASGTQNVMKIEDKIDTIISQVVGIEPFLSFPRARDSHVQWIHLLHALNQQGWPLLSPIPVKVQLLKCEKCSQEFCSPINYRRHIRVHHRLKNLAKDHTTNRDLLAAYWDKLSVEKAKEVVSFNNVMLEEVPGSSVLNALTILVQRQVFSSFPQSYVRAGATLLDIVKSNSSIFPISSQDLFSILDDASEKTCLCGTTVSMQRYVFGGEAGKNGLEPRNLVACTSFLLEQKLVNAWLADKDAEALRCQKQLVEEEEAAQKRQAEILERKRHKKLRQKEHKVREQRHGDKAKTKQNIDSTVEDLAPAESSLDTCAFEAHNPDTSVDNAPSHVPSQFHGTNEGIVGDTQSGYDLGTDQNIVRQSAHGHNHRTIHAKRQGMLKPQWTIANGLHASQNSPISNPDTIQKYGTKHDQSTAAIFNCSEVWSQKPTREVDMVVSKAIVEKEIDQCKNPEVLIGSIPVTLGHCSQLEGNAVAFREDVVVENLVKENSSQDKPMKPDFDQNGNNHPTLKFWRPLGRHDNKNPLAVNRGGPEADAVYVNEDSQNLSGPSSLRSCSIDGSDICSENNSPHPEGRVEPGSLLLSSHAARDFLAQRWKEALSLDHVKLVISPISEPPRRQKTRDSKVVVGQYSDAVKSNVHANAESRLPATSGVTKSKPRAKPEKGTKTKYIPKQKTTT
ncbi:PREDICTED: uncharacterized protein LOC109355301 isoform X2 [Lupinus angustifolius]|uniref:uncharacterized protein LOC109355301 isoform X2 n=1 Tax=Lupinus angustifolius TaxID=3871 RepID=UPI00092F271F|nr:PREDICTED: uncharacterized protein LOC109355301 isoform X2 [Lupinus angustifolius]